jgi:NAD-dependent deacetylase
MIRESQYMVAFTGAGSSTRSGIPDFRSPGSGLWENADPLLVASIWSFRMDPKPFYEWVRPLADSMLTATPNPAHQALARLEESGHLKAVITQNIDDLHQKAGSGRVLELHGHLREATCIHCYTVVKALPRMQHLIATGEIPHCQCGGVLKPNVIFFGEQLPIQVYNEATAEARRCDLMLVAGSSLEVTPAADIPPMAVDHGAKAIVINLVPIPFDSRADVVIHGDMAEVLPRIVDAL